jgi:hypothetical protein
MLRRVALVRTDVSEELSASVTSQNTAFFIVTAVKNLKSYIALTGWAL